MSVINVYRHDILLTNRYSSTLVSRFTSPVRCTPVLFTHLSHTALKIIINSSIYNQT